MTMTDLVPQKAEVYALDLDWDLIQHLAHPDSVRALQAECIDVRIIEDEEVKEVFLWQMNHVREHGQPASATVLEDEFKDLEFTKPETAIGDLVERLRVRYIRNHDRDLIHDLVTISREDPLAVGSEMMKMGRDISTLVSRRGESFGTHDWDRAVAHYDEFVLQGPGPTLGFNALDEHFNGVMGVTFLVAPPKRFKSWFAVNAMASQTMRGGYPNYYTLELRAVDVEWRLSCLLSGVPYWKYLKGKIDPQERKVMAANLEVLGQQGKWEIEKPAPGERSAIHLVERALNRNASCVIIDQLQYVENSRGVTLGAANNTGDYWEVCNALRDYSDEIPIFVVHQFNRTVQGADERPEMQQAKGSSAIEEVGTLVLGMWSNKEMRQNSVVEAYTMASRNFGFGAWMVEAELSSGCSLRLTAASDEDE